ncbi:MAG: hypothetical protein HY781_09695 [Chloroflexi bacterium]|nr:hypothetical protein [Chloroflexota bacterium]
MLRFRSIYALAPHLMKKNNPAQATAAGKVPKEMKTTRASSADNCS